MTKDGKDVSVEFNKGALEALKIAKKASCKEAILNPNSPSCGTGKIYDGTFTGKLIDGDGLFASALKKNEIINRTNADA